MKLHRKYWLISLTVLLFSCAKDESILFTQTVLQEPENKSLTDTADEEVTNDDGNQNSGEQTEVDENENTAEEEGASDNDGETGSENTSDPPSEPSVICATEGGMATESGLKTWCWGDVQLPNYTAKVGATFSNGQLKISSECFEKQVSKEGNRLKFSINPTFPSPGSWCSNSYNMRAEISTEPWRVNNPIGTEEWYGWNYSFSDGYYPDTENPWAFFQVHEGTSGETPLLAIWCVNDGGPGSGVAGEVHVVNNSRSDRNYYYPTGVVPKGGDTIDIVLHVVWGDEGNGLLEVWLNGSKVVEENGRTVRASHPVGGNAKFGIYKWPWRNANSVESSSQIGVTKLETYMGALRILTRMPGDEDYLENSFNLVSTR
ncbi:polysaccharide lyase-like protein [Flavobacteriaceae bacterium MAR_2009_75]|nr:polysaccharide lyase-like protein [Flavobacteriaceae bacterium MAR_2009_75]